MTYDPVRHKAATYLEQELLKLWENARSEKPAELHRTRKLAIEDFQRIMDNDGLLYRLANGLPEETAILRDCLGRLFGSSEERIVFFIDVVTTVCQQATTHGAAVGIAEALGHSSQGEKGLSGISRAITALEKADQKNKAA